LSFRNRIKYLLVHKAGLSNKEAQTCIKRGDVHVNNQPVYANQIFTAYDQVDFRQQALWPQKQYVYACWYKPVGAECTFKTDNADAIIHYLPNELKDLFYVGRLDKASEGLLLLTNDGNIHDKLLAPQNKVTKVYEVSTEPPIADEDLQRLQGGVVILGKQTLPCNTQRIDKNKWQIELTQGMNRQIRRMCHKLGYKVTQLKRISFANLHLQNLKPGEWRWITREDVMDKESKLS
jgi:23S rRNA pseudouridine2604 synthase